MRTPLLRASVLGLLLAFPSVTVAAYEVPVNDGFYTQTFEVLTPDQEVNIEQILTKYQQDTSNEIAILMLDTLSGATIEEAGLETGRKWRVGTEQNNNGILIIAALQEREMRIEVGYGLEGAVPDITAKGIIEQVIGPEFAEARYYEGLLAGIDALQKHIGGEYTADRYTEEEGSVWSGLFIFVLVFGNFLAALLGRSKSWWLGGVIGGIIGVILTILWTWWVAIPGFIVLGLLFDYVVSRNPPRGGRGGRGGYWGGGGFGGGGGGGGFGGFGGGSFGGGGASGRW